MAIEHLIFPSGDLGCNTALFWCDKTREGILVDPGGEPDEILALATENGVALRAIVLTHAHPDNLLAVPGLREATVCDVLLHKADRELWDNIEAQCNEFGWLVPDLGEVDEWLEEGSKIRFGREFVEIVHLPGHSPGHCGIVVAPLELLMCGDCCFAGGAGRTDLMRGDEEAQARSLDRLQGWPAGWTLLPGHGPTFTSADVPQARRRTSTGI